MNPTIRLCWSGFKGLSLRAERLTAAYKLGEIEERIYRQEITPLNERLNDLRSKLEKMEEIFTQLKMPRPAERRI